MKKIKLMRYTFKKNCKGYHSYGWYLYEDVIELIKNTKKTVRIDDFLVDVNSQRLKLFIKNRTCNNCNIVGKWFSLDINRADLRSNKQGKTLIKPHFNLYGIGDDGRLEMMTRDHIYPKSKGGTDTVDNYQCLCMSCNMRKGADVID